MRRSIGVVAILLLLGAAVPASGAFESAREYAVQLSANVRTSPPQISLSWAHDCATPPTGYTVQRKAPADTSWGAAVRLPATATSYVDDHVSADKVYEYQVVKTSRFYTTAYGYICSGIEVPPTETRGKLLLVVDHTYANELARELAGLEQDLIGDGWTVLRFDVNRTDSVRKVKRLIQAQYRAAPTEVKCVFLFGHAPVPYSGDIAPDGHEPAHQGAWPCDGYYGDMDGVWTDRTVNDTRASDARNHNVPGDGKFDQSTFPAPLKLMVGRVDLAGMPGREFSGQPPTLPSELELLRNYLRKDHQFRTRQFDLPRCGLVGDYFGPHNGEAFAASGWRNLSALLGEGNVIGLPEEGAWIAKLKCTPCLWAYGCGPGTYESIEGLGTLGRYHAGTTAQLVREDVKAAFVLLYGSWLGDWDAEDSLLRAVLTTPSYGLACAWSGRPHWFLHHMGMGEPIGYAARLTQNNGPEGLYHNFVNAAAGQIHIALMGDPTLRLHNVAPPTNLTGATNGTGITLQWRASDDAVLGYHVFRASNPSGPFTRLTDSPVTATSYSVERPQGIASYMIRAVKLETSASGTYFNLSEGALLAAPDGQRERAGPVAGGESSPVNGQAAE